MTLFLNLDIKKKVKLVNTINYFIPSLSEQLFTYLVVTMIHCILLSSMIVGTGVVFIGLGVLNVLRRHMCVVIFSQQKTYFSTE